VPADAAAADHLAPAQRHQEHTAGRLELLVARRRARPTLAAVAGRHLGLLTSGHLGQPAEPAPFDRDRHPGNDNAAMCGR
jgi:hypothetical protein